MCCQGVLTYRQKVSVATSFNSQQLTGVGHHGLNTTLVDQPTYTATAQCTQINLCWSIALYSQIALSHVGRSLYIGHSVVLAHSKNVLCLLDRWSKKNETNINSSNRNKG